MTKTINVSTVLTPYLDNLKNYKLLTKEEEIKLFQLIDIKEAEFIFQLASNQKIFQRALTKAVEKIKGKGEKDPEFDELFNKLLNTKNGIQNLFWQSCLQNGKISSVQESMYNFIKKEAIADKDISTCELFALLKIKREELQAIRNEFAKHNLRLVISLAKRYSSFSGTMKITDLVQEGNMGLLKAIEKFDSNRGVKFSTYASWWIKQSIRRAVHDKNRTIRLPVHMADSFYKVKTISAAFFAQHGREPTEAELIKETGFKQSQLRFILENGELGSVASLDRSYGEDDGFTMLDMISGDEISAEDHLYKREVNADLEKAMSSLTTKEAFIVRNRFDNELTLEEIGTKFDVSRERIRQIEAIALKKLKSHPNLKRHIHSLFFR